MSEKPNPYQLFMVGLCGYVLTALGVQSVVDLRSETLQILDIVDTGICALFLVDFVRNVVRAPDRWKYLYTWGWLDLISSLPTLDAFRWGRAAKAFRILRVLRGVRATRILGRFALDLRAESAFWGASFLAILVTVSASIGILHLERETGSKISEASDALWWAFGAVTMIGSEDLYPTTPSGRLLAAGVTLTGMGLLGTFTAYLASLFMASDELKQERILAEIRQEVRELREHVLSRTADLGK